MSFKNNEEFPTKLGQHSVNRTQIAITWENALLCSLHT